MLTITTTRPPATDLGFLLHKHPDHVHEKPLPFGAARVVFPEATDERCTAALLVEVDAVGLARSRRKDQGFPLAEYVSDRPYVASSFLSVALARVFGTALGGRCAKRPELVDQAIPLTATVGPLPARGGERFVRELFEPLGYAVAVESHALDTRHAEWGASRYVTLGLEGRLRLRDLLAHLYVLVPVLDDQKHYWVGEAEVEKLLRRGEGWLATHPARDAIASRYLRRRKGLVRQALEQLVLEEEPDLSGREEEEEREEQALERPLTLNEQRLAAVTDAVKASGARRVVDLGCGEGRLLPRLLKLRQLEEVVGADVSSRALEIAERRLRLDRMSERQRKRVRLLQASLTYRDERLQGFDAAALVEVIEHVEAGRLPALERALFGFARPGTVVVTTPNIEYNVRFDGLEAGRLRHRDHRFEWTRAEFEEWARGVGARYGYGVELAPVGPVDEEVGSPTQMATFRRSA